jgi:hypothetical protein
MRTDGQTDRDRQRRTDMRKLIVAFRNFANTPNNSHYTLYRYNESNTAADFFFAFNSTDLHAYKTCSNSLSRIFRELRGILVRFPAEVRDSVLEIVPTGDGPTHAPIQRAYGASSRGGKQTVSESDYSPPSSAVIKNPWIYTSTPPYVFKAWCLIKHRNNFTF